MHWTFSGNMQGSITVIPRHRNEADAPKCECLAQDHRAEVGNQDSNPGCLAPEPHSSCSIFTLYRSKCVLVIQLCPTLCNPMDCSPPGSSVHEIFQASILEWVAISFRGSSQPRDWTQVSCTAGGFFTDWATRVRTLKMRSILLMWDLASEFSVCLILG